MVIRRSIVVAAVVLVLGLLSVGAGLVAEFTGAKAFVDDECIHPSGPTMALAITAAVALLLLRIVVRVAIGRGYACCRTDPNIPKLIRYCIILAWLMSFAAVGQFIAGAKLICSQKHLLLTASIEAFVSLCLTMFYYLVIASTQNVPNKPSVSEVELEAPPVAMTNDTQIPPVVPPHME